MGGDPAVGGGGGAGAVGGMGGNGGAGPTECDPGYALQGDECVDIDECAIDMHACVSASACVNLPGSHGCRCAAGTVGDGLDSGAGCVTVSAPLLLWLDGADPLDTLVPPADDQPLSTWHDRSGNGFNAEQGTAAKTPQYVAGAQNAHGVIRFDGAADADADGLDIDNSGGQFDLTNATLFIVSARRFTTPAPLAPGVFAVRDGNATRMSLHYGTGGENILIWNGTTLVGPAAPSPIQPNDYHLVDVTWAGGSESLRIDGTEVSMSAHGWNAGETFRGAHIGWSGAPGEHLNGDIAEVVLYSGALSPTDRATVASYLGNKWGIFILTSGAR